MRFRSAAVVALTILTVLVSGAERGFSQAPAEIRIGLLAPLTGPIAKSGVDSVRGHELFWEQQGYKMAGRPVKVLVADTACNPDNAITHARRLVHAEKVHFIVGPLCGHEGPAVAQVSRETGVPVLVSIAGADELTKWKRVPSVIRTGFSASQTSHPFGDRKSTRLNSSHGYISYAVFCLKKKKRADQATDRQQHVDGFLAGLQTDDP